MDATRCPQCQKGMKVVMTPNRRTDFKCLKCDLVDPLQTDARRWADGPLALSTADWMSVGK